MALSGSETTALQSFGVPGMPRSFSAKAAAVTAGYLIATPDVVHHLATPSVVAHLGTPDVVRHLGVPKLNDED